MAEFNLKMIKIFFSIAILTVVVVITSGMNIVKYSPKINWKKVEMELSYFRYEMSYARQGRGFLSVRAETTGRALSVPVLLYHGIITDYDWEEDGTNIKLHDFKDQMFALKSAGYTTITLTDFLEYIKGRKDLPDKAIMITFDDGRKDSYYKADPIFKTLDYNAVMFLIAGRSLGKNAAGDEFYLGKGELEDMVRSRRWEIQSHGDFDHDWEQIDAAGAKGHFMSNLLWLKKENRSETADEAKKRILNDLVSAKEKIENELGQNVQAFAYPFNDYGQNGKNFPEAQKFISEKVSEIYPLTFFQEEVNEPLVNFPGSNDFMMKRINVDSSVGSGELLDLLEQNRQKSLPYKDTFWNDHGWRTKWGATRIWGDLALGESQDKGGNMTVLLGSSLWKNYFAKSKITITKGNSVSQVVRYVNEENYAKCDFEAGGTSIFQKINGENIVVASRYDTYNNLLNGDFEIGAEVRDNTIGCYLNGQKMLEGALDPSIAAGGIGFYTWDDLPGNISVTVKELNVYPGPR